MNDSFNTQNCFWTWRDILLSNQTVPLETLDGMVGLLEGVDIDAATYCDHYRNHHHANIMAIRFNGKTYIATEDPSDDYRSALGALFATDTPCCNVFDPVQVQFQLINTDNEIMLRAYDTATRKLVLEVGTDYRDDYYPCFVSSFHPENLAINAER